MRVLVDAHLFDDSIHQGTRTYLRGLYNELIELCPQIKFYFACSDFQFIQHEIPLRPNVEYLKIKSKNKIIRLLIEFPYLIVRYRIDYSHYQYISPAFKFSKEIVTIHDLLFLDFPEYFPLQYRLIKNFLFKRSAKRADLLLTVSGYSKRAIALHYKIEPAQIHITPNGVSVSLQTCINEVSEKVFKSKYDLDKYILYVSRIEPRKNHLNLLKAFVELKLWPDYNLVFVGKSSIETPELNSYWIGLSQEVKERIKHYEMISNEDLAHFYKGCTLFVFPSYAEGFGIPPIEATLFETRVLCSNQTAMSDFSFLGDSLFDPHDYEQMKLKIAEKLKINIDIEVLSILKEYVLDSYSWRYSAQILKRLLETNGGV